MLRILSIEEVAFISGGMMEDSDDFDDGSGGDFGDGGDGSGGGDGGGGDYGDSGDTSGGAVVNTDDGDIVVTGHRPPIEDLGGNESAQFYNDGIAVLYYHGSDGQYVKQGNFTYTVTNTGQTNSHTNTANTTPPGITDTQTITKGNTVFQFTHTNLP